MAEGDGTVYNEAKRALLAGEIDLDAHTIKIGLLTGHTPDVDTHLGWADISGDEVSGTGYTAGGKTLAGKSVVLDSGSDKGVFDATDPEWTGLDAGTPNYAVMYDDSHANKALVCYWEVDTATNGGNWGLTFHADGVLLLS